MSIKDRGFASMDAETRKRVTSMGGKAAHAKGTAHEWTSEQAMAAGKKGGATTAARRRARLAAGGGNNENA